MNTIRKIRLEKKVLLVLSLLIPFLIFHKRQELFIDPVQLGWYSVIYVCKNSMLLALFRLCNFKHCGDSLQKSTILFPPSHNLSTHAVQTSNKWEWFQNILDCVGKPSLPHIGRSNTQQKFATPNELDLLLFCGCLEDHGMVQPFQAFRNMKCYSMRGPFFLLFQIFLHLHDTQLSYEKNSYANVVKWYCFSNWPLGFWIGLWFLLKIGCWV